MPITEADIQKISQLAHLDVQGDELRAMAAQMGEIVSYVEQLNELDTANVDPALGGLTPEGARTDSTRDDLVESSLGQDVALAEAPDPAEGYFRVPKVL